MIEGSGESPDFDTTNPEAQWDRGALACVGLSVAPGELIGMVLQPDNRRWGDTFARSRVVDR